MKTFQLALTILFCCASIIYCSSLSAQLPQRVAVDLRVYDASAPIEGAHRLTIRWYDTPTGGSASGYEDFDVVVENGRVQVHVGSTAPIPLELLHSGNAWLGISVDNAPELSPRTMLVSVPYAQFSDRALVADRLSPDVTGVVTSLNEIAGAVKVLGEGGIVVRTDGDLLVVSNEQPLESGVVQGNDKQHVFIIKPLTKISLLCRVTASVVSPTTTITCGIASVDVVTNTISIVTSAALARNESIQWFLLQR
ncbi:MAG: hypothetical protein SGJ05_03865 [bacterium]|nr:hypothetical protein [bacterium]